MCPAVNIEAAGARQRLALFSGRMRNGLGMRVGRSLEQLSHWSNQDRNSTHTEWLRSVQPLWTMTSHQEIQQPKSIKLTSAVLLNRVGVSTSTNPALNKW